MKRKFEVEMVLYASNDGSCFEVPVALVERIAYVLEIVALYGEDACLDYQSAVMGMLLLAQELGCIDSIASLHLLFDSVDKFLKGVQDHVRTSND